ncbi:hypothetical protein GCM10010458_39690 [Microbacterium luteolum]|uniref:META domain-containing protein n=1 Tax=Microbacterium luteolum TaxID=69367 RepID=A0ABY7XL13_MICLT|nr:hypothetical protein [Microbacterium luteolum]WDM42806.1 hypothetical protein KV395_05800 [Microbacterium luteolum]
MAPRVLALVSSTSCLLLALALVACTSPEPEPAPTPEITLSPDDVMGEWESEVTDEARLRIQADGTFAMGGLCVVSGTWTVEGNDVEATSLSIPGIGGCPDVFALDRAGITSFELLDRDELRVLDVGGAHATFHRAD